MTRRSHVQILPPPLAKYQFRRGPATARPLLRSRASTKYLPSGRECHRWYPPGVAETISRPKAKPNSNRELIETLGMIENGSASDAVDQTTQWSMWV
jgi:hypothetical protein